MSPSGSCFECLIPSWWKTILGGREEPTMWGLTERTGSLGIDSWWYIIPDHFRSLCFLPNIMKKSPTPALEPSLVTHANPSTWEWVPGGPGIQDYWCQSHKKAKQMIKKKNHGFPSQSILAFCNVLPKCQRLRNRAWILWNCDQNKQRPFLSWLLASAVCQSNVKGATSS